MRFPVDARRPRRLPHRLREAGLDAGHTLDRPDRNHTSAFVELTRTSVVVHG
jgi:hypothetical protein